MQFGGSRPWRRRGNYSPGSQGQGRERWSNQYYDNYEENSRGWNHRPSRPGHYNRNWDDRSYGNSDRRNFSNRPGSQFPPHSRFQEDRVNPDNHNRPVESRTSAQSGASQADLSTESLNQGFANDPNIDSDSIGWKTPPLVTVEIPSVEAFDKPPENLHVESVEKTSNITSPSQDACLSPTTSLSTPSITSQSDYQSVVDLANKITSLGPLIRDPRLISRVFKMQKESSMSSGSSTSPKKIDLQVPLDDPVKDKEIAKSIIEECEMMSGSLKTETSALPLMPKEPGIIRRIPKPIIKKDLTKTSLQEDNILSKHVTDTQPSKPGERIESQSLPVTPTSPPSNRAQSLVKDSFLKLKEGRAKMSAPSKNGSKHNQALLKMVIDSEGIPSEQSTSQKTVNPTVPKPPGLKNILNTMMKTSISNVLRTNMDSQSLLNKKNDTSNEQSSSKELQPGEINIEASKKSVSSLVDDKLQKSMSPPKETQAVSKAVEQLGDSTDSCSKETEKTPSPPKTTSSERRLARIKTSPRLNTRAGSPEIAKITEKPVEENVELPVHTRTNTARKGGTTKHTRPDLEIAEIKIEPPTTAKDTSGKNRKNRRRHFRGGTYSLYLSRKDSQRKRKKKTSKSPETSVQGEESSSIAETTGSVIDSTDEGSCPSEDVQTNSEKSYPDEDSSANSNGEGVKIKLENENSMGNEMKDMWDKNREQQSACSSDNVVEIIGQAIVKQEILDDQITEPSTEQDFQIVDDEHSNDTLLSAPISNSATAKKGVPNKETLESIALSVKSRQRIKRRFTEEHSEFNGDLPYLNSTHNSPKKSRRGMKVIPDVSAGATNPIPKMEMFYDSDLALMFCTCQEKPLGAPSNEDVNSKIYCQAIDTIDEKLIGCCNEVSSHQLFRPAPKIPFTAMCEVHLWRLHHHQCCPVCGIFCSQGHFAQCTAVTKGLLKNHLYHKECSIRHRTASCLLCPHCGSEDHQKLVVLELNTPTAAQFFMTQKPFIAEPLARMTLCRLTESKEVYDPESKSYTILESGKILSSAGLPQGADRTEVENLLDTLSNEKLSTLNYSGDELYTSAKNGEIENVLYMLALGFDPNKKFAEFDGDTAVHAAATSGHLVTLHLLLQSGASADHMNDRLYTPLMMAVEARQLMIVQYLIKTGAQLNAKGEDGTTALHLAARCGSLEICRVLLDTGKVIPNIQDDGGWTPIVWACEHQHLELVKLLLERGADPNIRDNEENIALHWSAYSGNVDISQILLEVGCDLNVVNEHGDTPLHVSARQNKYESVVLFLARGANVEAKNKEDEVPMKCVVDQNSNTYMALMMNSKLKKMTLNRPMIAERVIHKDISRGKEQNPLQCVNGVDDEAAPFDFLYIIKNCETSPINIDRTITSLQSCQCEDDCTSSNCTCATISFKCWYDNDGRLLPEFNMPDPPMIFECNRACTCWKSCNNRVLQHGILSRLQLFRTEGKGWGVRTLKDIPRGTFICEYIGEIISDSEADQREDDSYLFDLDNRDGETYCLDARYYGNISRFVNHLCEPNLVPVKVFVEHQDLSFPRIAFFSSRDIKAGEELGFDYGEKFWVIKYKWFTCACSSKNCKYSKDTIQQTLESYYRRLKEDHPEDVESVPQIS